MIASPPSTDPSTPCPRPPDSQRLPRIASHRHKASWLLVAAAILALALGLHGPIAQWASYHAFAHARAWLGLPNAQNVLSNLPFALLGLWGVRTHSRSRSGRPDRPVWFGFSLALICTAPGSALCHGANALRDRDWWIVLGLYAAARLQLR